MPRGPTFPVYHEPWATCQVCGWDVPRHAIAFSSRYGWRCTGPPGNNCWAVRPDRIDYLANRKFRPGEGSRRTLAPRPNPNEGIDAGEGAEAPFAEQVVLGGKIPVQ